MYLVLIIIFLHLYILRSLLNIFDIISCVSVVSVCVLYSTILSHFLILVVAIVKAKLKQSTLFTHTILPVSFCVVVYLLSVTLYVSHIPFQINTVCFKNRRWIRVVTNIIVSPLSQTAIDAVCCEFAFVFVFFVC